MSHVTPDDERSVEKNFFALEVRNGVFAPVLACIALIPIESVISHPSIHVCNHYTRRHSTCQAVSHGRCPRLFSLAFSLFIRLKSWRRCLLPDYSGQPEIENG